MPRPKKITTDSEKKTKDITTNIVIEYQGKNTNINDIIETVKTTYRTNGNAENIETLNIYFQPDSNKAYYVVNGKPQKTPVEI